jgi:hypothetical protein
MMGTGGSSCRVKQQWREADHSHSSGAEVKNGGALSPLPKRLHVMLLN